MNKRIRLKRLMVMLLTLTMILGCFGVGGKIGVPGVSNAKELNTATDAELTTSADSELSVTETGETEGESFSYEDTYNSENFDVNFKLDNVWDAGYNATITITNTSDSVIENWCLTFPLNENIADIWNASVSETHEDFYVIKNAGWNQDIAAGQSVSFGITVYEPFTEYPEYYTILGNEVEIGSEDYTVDYKITEDWGEGYKAEVTITNNKNVAIEDWRLTFDYGDNIITQIWNALIASNIDGKYELSCESYNQNIAPKGSVTFGFMVEPGCSGKLMENVVLKEYVAAVDNTENNPPETGEDMDDVEKIALIFSEINDENNSEIYLDMMANVEISSYDIYMSFDEGDFEKVGATEDYQYIYSITNGCSSIEIYAVGYDLNNVAVESNHIYVQCKDGVYATVLPDTDGDGLEDVYEIYYGSDVNLEDSDEDGLGDYYEVYASSTYPGLADSDDNKIMDGDEDYDGDGLSTLEECNKGTDPLNPDTDYDNLSDGEEVNVCDTDPLVADWDEDGLVDGDEIALGTDPQLYDTDEDGVKDGDEKFKQTYTHQVENQESPVTEVSVTLEGTGNLETTTHIESVMNKDALCTGVVGLVGEPFSIETTSKFESATITFKVDKELLEDNSFDSLMFLWYDEENQNFVELDTVLDETTGCVSVETTHFSKYMLVNRKKWFDAWAVEMDYIKLDTDNIDDEAQQYTIISIDVSERMMQYDPVYYVENVNSQYDAMYRKKNFRIDMINQYMKNMPDTERLSVMFGCRWGMGFNASKENIMRFMQTVDEEIVDYDYFLMTGYYNAFEQLGILDSPVAKKIIIVIAAGSNLYNCDMEKWTKKYVEKGIVVDLIIIGADTYVPELVAFSKATGGSVWQADDGAQASKYYLSSYDWSTVDKTDTDGDGLYDVVERNGMRLSNGNVIYTNWNEEDSDGDGLLDGEEVNPVPVYKTKEVYYAGTLMSVRGWVFELNSDPNNTDTDGDGIRDDKDNRPIIIGIYSEKADEIVVGELSIVASTYKFPGHCYLLYKSYIIDSLDFSGFSGGFKLLYSGDNVLFYTDTPKTRNIKCGEYITIGNSSVTMNSLVVSAEGPSDIGDSDVGGVYYNREFAAELDRYKENGKEVYTNNSSYTKEVTKGQIDEVLEYHNKNNYYHLIWNNCTIMAAKSWNKVFSGDMLPEVTLPSELKKGIQVKGDYHSIRLLKVLGVIK